MADIVCPNCQAVTELAALRRDAKEFCWKCDYPLFWVSSGVPTTRPGTTVEEARRRLPGAAGRQRVGSRVCPNPKCGELSPLGATHCWRCDTEFDPKPPEPVVIVLPPPPAPEPIVVVVAPPPAPPPPWWYWWPLGVIGAAIVIRILIAIF